MAKAAFNKERTLHQQIGLKFKEESRKVLYLDRSCVRGAETWTFRRDQKYLESFEMWCCSWMENISWSDRVGN